MSRSWKCDFHAHSKPRHDVLVLYIRSHCQLTSRSNCVKDKILVSPKLYRFSFALCAVGLLPACMHIDSHHSGGICVTRRLFCTFHNSVYTCMHLPCVVQYLTLSCNVSCRTMILMAEVRKHLQRLQPVVWTQNLPPQAPLWLTRCVTVFHDLYASVLWHQASFSL